MYIQAVQGADAKINALMKEERLATLSPFILSGSPDPYPLRPFFFFLSYPGSCSCWENSGLSPPRLSRMAT